MFVWVASPLSQAAKALIFEFTCIQTYFSTKLFHTCHTYRHHIPLSLTLTVPGGHKVSAKENLLILVSHTLFRWSGWNLIWWWSSSSWTTQYYFWVRFDVSREINCCFLTASTNFNIGMHSDVYESIWFELGIWYDDRYYWTLHFDASLIDLDFDSRSQQCKKWRKCQLSQKFSMGLNGISVLFCTLLRLVVMNLIVIPMLCCLFSIQGREPYLCDFCKTKPNPLTLACIQTFTDWFLSNLVWW